MTTSKLYWPKDVSVPSVVIVRSTKPVPPEAIVVLPISRTRPAWALAVVVARISATVAQLVRKIIGIPSRIDGRNEVSDSRLGIATRRYRWKVNRRKIMGQPLSVTPPEILRPFDFVTRKRSTLLT